MGNYIYAVARAKAKEATLVGESRLNRMIDSLSDKEALKILSEVGFGGGAGIEDVSEFETLIEKESESLSSFIKEVCPDEKVKRFLLLDNDYKNAEAFIKEKHIKADSGSMRVPDGFYSADMMREKIMTDDYRSFSDVLAKTLIKADELFVSGKFDGLSVGGIFERGKYAEMAKLVKNNKTLSDIFKVKVDTANVTTCLRGRDYSLLKDFLFDGGTLSDKELKSLCEDAFDTLRERFSTSHRKEFILSAIEDAEKGKPLSSFEKKADDYALNYLLKYKYKFEGIAPFILYVYYKRAELFNVRLIIVSLSSGVSADDIKKRLRVSYER